MTTLTSLCGRIGKPPTEVPQAIGSLRWNWRRQRDAGSLGALTPTRRGPKLCQANPLAAKLALLEKNNAHLTRCLARAEAIIDVHPILRSCWASRWRRTAARLDPSRRRDTAGKRYDRRL